MKYNRIFSYSQAGYIAEITEPVNYHTTAEYIKQIFKSEPKISAIPMESEDGIVGMLERNIVALNSSFSGTLNEKKLNKFITSNIITVDARENVETVLGYMLEGEKAASVCMVYYLGRYFGVLSIEKLIKHIFYLRNTELERAEAIQKTMIGEGEYSADDYKIKVNIKMANNVGGDFYYINNLSENVTLLSCFDVSGKDISASLITGLLNGFFSSFEYFNKEKELTPLKIITSLNDLIERKTPDGYFIASIFIFINKETKEYQIFNMGYGPLYRIAFKDGKKTLKIFGTQYQPVGFPELSILEEKVISGKYFNGLKFFGFSDGLTDAQNVHGEFFGEDEVEDFIKELLRKGKGDIQGATLEKVNDFIGNAPRTDDITLFSVDFN